jgi:hypothetical protein
MQRYIDAEKLKDDIRRLWHLSVQILAILAHIDHVPTADVQEVKHGHWIKSPECPEEYDICSVCGLNDKHRTRADQEHPAFESLPPYCKWCGAKMDEKEDGDE